MLCLEHSRGGVGRTGQTATTPGVGGPGEAAPRRLGGPGQAARHPDATTTILMVPSSFHFLLSGLKHIKTLP